MSDGNPSHQTPKPRPHRSRQERKCDYCSQTFFKVEHLARHVRTHTRERPYQCDTCNKTFTRHDTLLRHARTHPESPLTGSGSGRQRFESGSGAGASTPDTQQSNSQNTLDGKQFSPNDHTNPVPTVVAHVPPAQMNQMMNLDEATGVVGNLRFSSSRDIETEQIQPSPRFDGEVLGGSNFNDGGLWSLGFDMNWPSWSVGSDFDLHAMNASIAATIMPVGPIMEPSYEQFPGLEQVAANANYETASKERWEAIWRNWTSHLDPNLKPTARGTITPMNESETNERSDVDEVYRSSLAHRLRPRSYDNSLPSTDFLNLCVSLYFARFHLVFPIVHAPTFRPSMANSLLLISICSIGSLFIGSTVATAQGVKIFETLHKCILNSWERYVAESSNESLSMVQAAIIGQTFGLLSGNPNHPKLVDAFNGTLISWARQGKMFKLRQAKLPENQLHDNEDALDKAWKTWIQEEQMIRLVLALQVHDAELAVMFHHEPLLRHDLERIAVASNESVFNAANSVQWNESRLQEADRQSRDSMYMSAGGIDGSATRFLSLTGMTGYAILEGIRAKICEERQQNRLDDMRQADFVRDLISWSAKFSTRPRDQSVDSLCLMILWHSLFISLFSDLDILEISIGRDGPTAAQEVQQEVRTWASLTSAKRCVLHASLLSNLLEAMPVGNEPAIHVPQCGFIAAVSLYIYAQYAVYNDLPARTDFSDFHEVQQLGLSPATHLFKTTYDTPGKPTIAESRRLCGMRDMLQRVGHWGISRRYSTLLGILLDGEAITH